MELELSKVVNSYQQMMQLSQKNLPAKVSFRLSKILKEMEENVKYFEETRSNILSNNNAELDEENNQWKMPEDDESINKIQEELNSLLQEQIQLNSYKSIKISELGNVELTTNMFLVLDWLFEDDEE